VWRRRFMAGPDPTDSTERPSAACHRVLQHRLSDTEGH
jgi:hypothetical protein